MQLYPDVGAIFLRSLNEWPMIFAAGNSYLSGESFKILKSFASSKRFRIALKFGIGIFIFALHPLKLAALHTSQQSGKLPGLPGKVHIYGDDPW